MVLDIDFSEMERDLERLADNFDTEVSGTGRDPETGQFASPKDRIQIGIDRAMDDIVQIAREDASEHVPARDAATIRHRSNGWRGDRYSHEFFSSSALVAYHEWGTGGRATDPGRGTTNDTTFDGRPGYRIEPNTKDFISFRWPDAPSYLTDEDGYVYFDYVVHPGVTAQHFMRDALQRNSFLIREEVRDQLSEIGLEL